MTQRKSWECPRCEMITTEYPALSRRDNKTNICSKCGEQEAFEDFFTSKLTAQIDKVGGDKK